MWVSLHLLELSQYLNLAWAALEATLPVAAQPPHPHPPPPPPRRPDLHRRREAARSLALQRFCAAFLSQTRITGLDPRVECWGLDRLPQAWLGSDHRDFFWSQLMCISHDQPCQQFPSFHFSFF